jgi:hypothetical protein
LLKKVAFQSESYLMPWLPIKVGIRSDHGR